MAPSVFIDGSNVTNLCVAGSWTHRLNRPWQASVTIPFTDEVGGPGSILRIENGGDIVHHGQIQLVETNPDENFGYTIYNSSDPMELLQWRPVRDDTCDFSLPTIIDDYGTGPQIVEAMLMNSEGINPVGCLGADCEDANADVCEGSLFIDYGTFETDGCDLTGAPTDWPMTIAQLTSLLISTGCLDVVYVPVNPGGGILSEVSAYNGDFGTDLSGSVVFEYGTGAFNISKFRRVQDMTVMCNKLWYYAGPRLLPPSDPAGDQHWCFNVTGTPGPLNPLPDPMPNGADLTTFLANRITNRGTYGTRMDIQIFDARDQDCAGLGSPERGIYLNRWETESWIRNQPRDLVHVTPTRETAIGSFEVGDLVGIEIPILGINAAQRVYEFTVSWGGEESVLALSELQTSPTADA